MALRNIVAAAVLLMLGAAYGYLAMQLPERGLPNIPGPSFFPYLIAILLLGLSLGLLAQGIRGYRREPLELNLPNGAVVTFTYNGDGTFNYVLVNGDTTYSGENLLPLDLYNTAGAAPNITGISTSAN